MASGVLKPGREEIQRAADRLRGQLVLTPVIGDVLLWREAGMVRAPRLKAECLQTGGSVEYRGALHYLLRRLGNLKGVVFGGPPSRLLACARAAHSQRLPFVAVSETTLPTYCRELIRGCGGSVEETMQAAKETGYHVLPGVEDEDFGLGVATLGLELGQELPSDLARVYVSPAELAPSILAGLSASGHGAEVVAVKVVRSDHNDLRQALLQGANLQSNDAGLAALHQAMADGDVDSACVIV